MDYLIIEELEESYRYLLKGEGNPIMKEVGTIIGVIEPFFISKEELDEFRKEGSIYRVYTNGKAYIFCSRKSLTSFLSKNELKDFEASVELIRYKGEII